MLGAKRLKRGCPFKPICFFASLDDLGRVGDSSLIEESKDVVEGHSHSLWALSLASELKARLLHAFALIPLLSVEHFIPCSVL